MKSRKIILRLISFAMLVVAVVFVACALACPTLGSTFYIFGFPIGAELWRIFYALYTFVMAGLFVVSFFIDEGSSDK